MSVFLFIIGIITVVIGVISGIFSGSFLGFLLVFAASIVSSTIFFALSIVLEGQREIFAKLQSLEDIRRRYRKQITCTRCEKEYDNDCSSCPHCAFKP